VNCKQNNTLWTASKSVFLRTVRGLRGWTSCNGAWSGMSSFSCYVPWAREDASVNMTAICASNVGTSSCNPLRHFVQLNHLWLMQSGTDLCEVLKTGGDFRSNSTAIRLRAGRPGFDYRHGRVRDFLSSPSRPDRLRGPPKMYLGLFPLFPWR